MSKSKGNKMMRRDAPSARRIIKNMVPWEYVSKEVILQRQGRRCFYCFHPISPAKPPQGETCSQATLDHVVPLSLGGSHTYSNLVACCKECNFFKGNYPEQVDISILLSLVV